MENLSESYNNFAIDLYRNLTTHEDQNVFYSSYSILAALAMCTTGARNETEKQLKEVLHLSQINDIHGGNLELMQHLDSLSTANKIFYKDSACQIEQEFLGLLEKFYKSETQILDFSNAEQCAKIINDWVEGQTNKKIQNLVPKSAIDIYTQMMLVNAIYFHGCWVSQFEKASTKYEAFILNDQSEKQVEMMHLNGQRLHYLNEPGGLKASVCRLLYTGEKIAMTIILPHHNTRLSEVESKLLNEPILKTILSFESKAKLNVALPRFKLEQSFELSHLLSAIGAPDAFDPSRADFTGIKADRSLFIRNVIHKAVVEVNEEGTKAAAATVVQMKLNCAVEHTRDFPCNKPFMFIIHDTVHHIVLFMGKYVKPEK